MEWELPKSKKVMELEKENQELYQQIFKLEKEVDDLNAALTFSDQIIAEFEGRVKFLKQERKELENRLKPFQNQTEINNCPSIVHNERGAGRKSRVDEKTLELIKSMQKQGLSHRQIARKLTEATGKPWSKSTIGYILSKTPPRN